MVGTSTHLPPPPPSDTPLPFSPPYVGRLSNSGSPPVPLGQAAGRLRSCQQSPPSSCVAAGWSLTCGMWPTPPWGEWIQRQPNAFVTRRQLKRHTQVVVNFTVCADSLVLKVGGLAVGDSRLPGAQGGWSAGGNSRLPGAQGGWSAGGNSRLPGAQGG